MMDELLGVGRGKHDNINKVENVMNRWVRAESCHSGCAVEAVQEDESTFLIILNGFC